MNRGSTEKLLGVLILALFLFIVAFLEIKIQAWENPKHFI